MKCDCINVSVVNGNREPIWYCFALRSPPGHILYNQLRIKLLKKINKSVPSHITFFLEDDDHKAVNFNNEMINFTCQIFKI